MMLSDTHDKAPLMPSEDDNLVRNMLACEDEMRPERSAIANQERDAHMHRVAKALLELLELADDYEYIYSADTGLSTAALNRALDDLTPPSWHADESVLAVIDDYQVIHHKRADGQWWSVVGAERARTTPWYDMPGPVRVLRRRYTDTGDSGDE